MNFECPICNELGDAKGNEADFSNGLCMIAKCGHVFHKRCLDKWQPCSAVKTCPTCRQPCEQIWSLFGATRAVEATTAPTTSIPECYEDLKILYTTLQDDYNRVTEQLKFASEDSQERDRRSDKKDVEIRQLKLLLRRCNDDIEELETKLAMSESLIS